MLGSVYFDLRDEAQLPPGSRFLDPYDHTPFLVQAEDTLPTFITRFTKSREEKSLPEIEPTQLRQLIVDSLYMTTPMKTRDTYFKAHQMNPNFSQIYSAIKATAINLSNGKIISPKQRASRAAHCHNNCRFHARSKKWSETLTNAISKVIGIDEATVSEAEKALGVCQMCGGCALRAKVGFTTISSLASLMPEQIDSMLRAYKTDSFKQCWIFEESLQNKAAYEVLFKKLTALNSNAPHIVQAIQYMQMNAPRRDER